MKLKPAVYHVSTMDDFQPYYWDVKELHILCKRFGLIRQGVKAELISRIEAFLGTGAKNKVRAARRVATARDSDMEITTDTLVVNYNNDEATRKFFIQEVGPQFRFNAYLRQFRTDVQAKVTYGALVAGYRVYEERKKSTPPKAIDKQFEYNQFQRDYFLNEPTNTRSQCLEAWKLVRSIAGPFTYAVWKALSIT